MSFGTFVLIALSLAVHADCYKIEKAFELKHEHGCLVRSEKSSLHISVVILYFKHEFEMRSVEGVVSDLSPD